MKPRVSVIIPCYNTAEFVAETLDSVLAQTYRDFEVVVVNDGSPDTPELERVLEPYRDRIVYIVKENGGCASARNRGIASAQGELIALIDPDDIWMPNYLEDQVARLDADPGLDIVFPNMVFFGPKESGKRLALDPSVPVPEATFLSLVTEQCVVVVSVLARRTAFERAGLFDERLRRCEDFDLWLRCLKTGSRISGHHTVLLRYRRRAGSLTANEAPMLFSAAGVLRKMRETVELTDVERRAIDAKVLELNGNALFFEGKRAFLQGDYRTAKQKMRESNALLKQPRITGIQMLLALAPELGRKAYAWRYRNS